MYNFEWKVSYRDQVGYRVYGLPGTSYQSEAIEEYRKLDDHDYDYDRKIYNGTPEEFAANILARGGGVALRISPHRMPQDLYEAFVAWKRQQWQENWDKIVSQPEKYGDYRPKPVVIPRPIYWSQEAKTWLTEPWFQETA